jgi:hypothetical protein
VVEQFAGERDLGRSELAVGAAPETEEVTGAGDGVLDRAVAGGRVATDDEPGLPEHGGPVVHRQRVGRAVAAEPLADAVAGAGVEDLVEFVVERCVVAVEGVEYRVCHG